MRKLKELTGLNINNLKSKAYFSRGVTNTNFLLNILDMKEGILPIKYLGVPLTYNYVHYNDCGNLFDRIQTRMNGWDCKLLSMAGKIELIHSVITPMVLYWMMIYQLPIATINKINKICANFIWSGKTHKIAWDILCRPKNEGGVGLRNFEDIRTATALKILWHYVNNNNLWSKWMRNRYCKEKHFWTMEIDNNSSCTWKTILKHRQIGLQHIQRSIVDGQDTLLWHDPWINNELLVNILGWDVLGLNGGDNIKVGSIIQNNTLRPQILHFTRQVNQIREVKLSNIHESDYWSWNNKPNGFNFYSAWDNSRIHHQLFNWSKIIWNHCNSPKMSLCIYKVILNRIPTKDKQIDWGYAGDPLCVLCNCEPENRNHLFFQCSYSAYLWTHSKLKLGMNHNSSMLVEEEAIDLYDLFKSDNQIKDLAFCSFITIIFHIWRERNARIHEGRETDKFQRWNYVEIDIKYQMLKSKKKTKRSKENEEILERWGIDLVDNG